MVGLPREVDRPATFSTGGHSRQFRGGMFLGPVPENSPETPGADEHHRTLDERHAGERRQMEMWIPSQNAGSGSALAAKSLGIQGGR
jgi:hypothetical protein